MNGKIASDGDVGVDARHDDHRHHAEGDGTEQVVHPQREERHFEDIAAEAADRLSRRIGQRGGAGPAQDVLQQIVPQQRQSSARKRAHC